MRYFKAEGKKRKTLINQIQNELGFTCKVPLFIGRHKMRLHAHKNHECTNTSRYLCDAIINLPDLVELFLMVCRG